MTDQERIERSRLLTRIDFAKRMFFQENGIEPNAVIISAADCIGNTLFSLRVINADVPDFILARV